MANAPDIQQRGKGEVEVFDKNPFGEIKIARRKKTTQTDECFIATKREGEIVGDVAGFWSFEDVDKEKFVKVYVKGLAAFEGMSAAGAKVFEILLKTMTDNYGKDTAVLQHDRTKALERDISQTTLRRGIQELIDRKFIARMPIRGLFWINPEFVFNGDRITFAKQYRLREKPAGADPRQMTVEGFIAEREGEESGIED